MIPKSTTDVSLLIEDMNRLSVMDNLDITKGGRLSLKCSQGLKQRMSFMCYVQSAQPYLITPPFSLTPYILESKSWCCGELIRCGVVGDVVFLNLMVKHRQTASPSFSKAKSLYSRL